MAGLAFVVGRKKELKKLKGCRPRSFYTNLYQQYDYFEKTGQMQFTPPVQVVYALRQAIKELREEGGVRKRYARYSRSWKTLRKGLEEMGFELLLAPEKEARILVTVKEPADRNFSFNKMHDELYKQGFTIYPGKLDDKDTFRLSVLGAIGERDIKRFLVALNSVLVKMKVSL
jgi:aspartate aminotransferase-like enzyme